MHILQLASGDVKGNEAAIAEVKARAGRLDVVIANAGKSIQMHAIDSPCHLYCSGVSKWYGPSLEAPVEEFNDHFQVHHPILLHV